MADTQVRVLLFDDSEEHARHLKKALTQLSCNLVVESSLYQATRRFKNAPFDLSIVNLDMPDDEGEEFASWLLDNYPRRQVILTGKEVIAEHEELLTSKSVVGFFPSPINQQVLKGVLKQSDRGLRGQVQRMQVVDLLKALRYSQKALTLMFDDAILQQEGWVYMKNSDVIHVEVYQRNPITQSKTLMAKGFDGFDLMMNFKNGAFSEQVWQEPEEKTIAVPFDGLMMNAAQKQDEAHWVQDESVRIRKALLIDNEAMSRMMLQQGLLSEGIDCQSLRSIDMIWEALESQNSELLILDASLEEAEVRESLTWLKNSFPNCRVLFLGTPNWQKEMPMPTHILPRPISPKRLKEILFELTQVGFRGFLNRIGVLEFLQLNLSAIDESKKLHIRDLSNRMDGQIFIDRGQFIHAQFGDLEGEDAFYKIAGIEKGDFFEDPSFQPPAKSLVDIMPHRLMIRAGRFAKPLDEPESEAPPEVKPEVKQAPKPQVKPVPIPEPKPMSVNAHQDVAAAKMQQATPVDAGTLNLGGAPEGGMTNLFGDDDDPPQIKLNLGGAPEGGMTNLFGDDDDPPQIKLNLGGAPEGGMTNLFGDDDDPPQIKLNLGGAPESRPRQPAAPPATKIVSAAPSKESDPLPQAAAVNSKLDEVRARWAQRRASLSGKTGPLTPPLSATAPSPARTGSLGSPSVRPSLQSATATQTKVNQKREAPQTPAPLKEPVTDSNSLFSAEDLEDINFSVGN